MTADFVLFYMLIFLDNYIQAAFFLLFYEM